MNGIYQAMAQASRGFQNMMHEWGQYMNHQQERFQRQQEEFLRQQEEFLRQQEEFRRQQQRYQQRYQPRYQRNQYQQPNHNRRSSFQHTNSNRNSNRNNRRNGANYHFSFGSYEQPEFPDISDFFEFNDGYADFVNAFFNQNFNQQQAYNHQNHHQSQNHQHHNSTPKFTKRTLTSSEYVEHMECPICLNRFDFNVEYPALKCGHFFHQECIEPWLQNNDTCPVCRQNIA